MVLVLAGDAPAGAQPVEHDGAYRIPSAGRKSAITHVAGLHYLADGRLVAAASTGELLVFALAQERRIAADGQAARLLAEARTRDSARRSAHTQAAREYGQWFWIHQYRVGR